MRRTNLAPTYGGLARWLARRLGCTPHEAEQRLQASRRAAWRMVATADELAADEMTADGETTAAHEFVRGRTIAADAAAGAGR